MPEGHYVPQFYLKEFTSPDTPLGYEPYVWFYEYETKIWKKKSPKNIASENNFYLITDEKGNKSDILEKHLSKIEGAMALVFKNKIIKKRDLDENDRIAISTFVAYMMTRTRKTKDIINRFTSEIAKRTMELYRSHPEAIKKLKDEYEADTGKILPEDFGEAYFDSSKYTINASNDFLNTLIPPNEDILRIISDMTWSFVFSENKNYFITSDSPYNMINPKIKSNIYGQGLIHNGIEVSLPLSKNVCFFGSWEEKNPLYLDVNEMIVQQLNVRRIMSSYRYVISPQEGFLGKEYLERHK